MLLDNKKNGRVGDALRKHLTDSSKMSVISSLFSIYGFESLKKELRQVKGLRLVLSQAKAVNTVSDDVCFPHLAGDRFELRFKNQLNQARVARECARWLTDKAEIRTAKNPSAFSQNLFHIQNGTEQTIAIQGSSGFTSVGLGYAESDSYHMNMCVSDTSSTSALMGWFETIWNDPSAVEDAKALLLEQLDNLVKDQAPEFIYFLTLYNLFKDFLEDIDEGNIIKTKTGFKETLVWNKLYKFQRDGVLGAIDKLERYNGCIIADSVGLGKTFEGLAVIKYYELRNDRVLVLCPKKLRDNWTVYTVNDKRNLLAKDRFNYDVLNHTDLTRLQGRSGEINLETLNWGNYDLIVIDESHNFRNNNPSHKKGLTRYARLMDEIIRSGVKTKVLMLSATPVNNRMNDLKNQVAFITEGIDDAYSDIGIISIEQTLKKAQTRFNQWLKRGDKERKVEKLLDSMNFDYFKLLVKINQHSGDAIEELGIEDIEVDSPEFDAFLIGRKVKVLIKDIDEVRWKQDLEEDREKLTALLSEARNIKPKRDAKLRRLKSTITLKCQQPLNENNKKMIVFTAFTDTANYLYKHLAEWAKETLGLYTAKITGSGTNLSTMPGIGNDFDTLLTAFSPVSKEREKIDETATDEIDFLIATDCISEGQNLQDCDYLVNYDIHWNPVRIIQRFGRIDRLGSKNKTVQLVNFWPNMELDEYINLEARVSGRMVLLDISATGEENVIEQDSTSKMNDLEYRQASVGRGGLCACPLLPYERTELRNKLKKEKNLGTLVQLNTRVKSLRDCIDAMKADI